jgi:hypothetical protein
MTIAYTFSGNARIAGILQFQIVEAVPAQNGITACISML